jgi:colanic acid/amylovoran biosynthesis glycosyltransferase
MEQAVPTLKIGYITKMYPRLSETFILNEILEMERRGAEVTIFSYKKPNEGRFHPQIPEVRAQVLYLEDLDYRKWPQWLGKVWPTLGVRADRMWSLISDALSCGSPEFIDLIMLSGWVAAQARQLGLVHLHAHFASLPSTIAYYASEISEIPFSFTAHAKDIFVYNMDEHLLRKKLLTARFVVTVTNYNFRYLMERAPEANPNNINVIYNGIDLFRFTANGSNSRESNLILGVGRLVPKKGFGDLLDACHILKNRGVDFRCVIVGDGLEAEMLLQKRRELNLESEVEFAGPRKQDEVLKLLHSATLLCLPCTVAPDGNQDALPTAILEALACGLPVVSTTVSGIPEIIDSGVDGLLVEPNDPQALSENLALLLKSKDLQSSFALKGRQKAEAKFDLRKNASQLFDLYLSKATEKRE